MYIDRACIIGAGAAGIAAAAALSRAGISFDWFEAGSQLGGLWRYGNETGFSVYASLMTNTSRRRMEWFGYTAGDSRNDYLTHSEVLEYLTQFARIEDIEHRITFCTRVTRVEPVANGGFRVTVEDRSATRRVRDYSAVIVANGRHARPKLPNMPGASALVTMHARDYRTPDIFAGKNVVVAGFGASGVDIASDAADVASCVILSTRSGGMLVPKYIAGRPRDENDRAWVAFLPLSIRKQMWRVANLRRRIPPEMRELARGAKPFEKPAVISDRFGELVERGKIVIKRGIQRAEGRAVIFEDGTCSDCDVLVFATGYETSYPFFSPELMSRNAGFVDRYLRVIPPDQPGLYFLGQLSVAGPLFPLFERQALWVADLLSGRCLPPRPERLGELARRESDVARKRFPEATQPYDTVDFYFYVRALEREHRCGRARASRSRSMPQTAPEVIAGRK